MSDPLNDVVICVSGRLSMKQPAFKSLVGDAGGRVVTTVSRTVTHVVASVADAEAGKGKVMLALEKGLPVVTEQWVHDSIEQGSLQDCGGDYDLGQKAPAAPMDADAADGDDAGGAAAAAASSSRSSSRAKGKKRKAAARDDDGGDDEEDDEYAAKPSKPRKKGAGSSAGASARSVSASMSGPRMVSQKVKGGVALDEYIPDNIKNSHRAYESGGLTWNVMLNQCNPTTNNNKFYVLTLLAPDSGSGSYYFFTRWGRVGEPGQNGWKKSGPVAMTLDRAQAEFRKKFNDKTKNVWGPGIYQSFTKYSGKYELLELAQAEEIGIEEDPDMPTPDSTLDPRVKEFVEFIGDQRAMNSSLAEIGYDASKLPVGKLSQNTISRGYALLKEIETALNEGAPRRELVELSGRFSTIIPIAIGRKNASILIIDSEDKLQERMELMDNLAQIEVGSKLLKMTQPAEGEERLHPADQLYSHLNCSMTPLDHDSERFQLIEEYVRNTHAKTHGSYELVVQEVFELDREGEAERFAPWAENENRQLLWHGSRRSNFTGIISQGLRIAPPEAPVTGYMFGKGVYFASSVSKSANYCQTKPHDNVGILLLSEVALGTPNRLKAASYTASDLPRGTHSTHGVGRNTPDESMTRVIDNGVQVPMGNLVKSEAQDTSLLYDEFIVYDCAQIRMRYLLKTEFRYKVRSR